MFQQDSSVSIKTFFLCTSIHAHIIEGEQNVVTIHLFSSLILAVIFHILTIKRATKCSGT